MIRWPPAPSQKEFDVPLDSSLNLDTVLAQAEQVLSADVGEIVVLLDPDRNAYYDIDPIGARIWRRLQTPTALRDIYAELMEAYDVDRPTCEADVRAFLTDALSEGIVRRVTTTDS